ncbi:hypothetical protein EJB05_55573, partial [Eragrostis curvula]
MEKSPNPIDHTTHISTKSHRHLLAPPPSAATSSARPLFRKRTTSRISSVATPSDLSAASPVPLKESSTTTPSLLQGLLRRLDSTASRTASHHVLAASQTSPTPRRRRCKDLSDLFFATATVAASRSTPTPHLVLTDLSTTRIASRTAPPPCQGRLPRRNHVQPVIAYMHRHTHDCIDHAPSVLVPSTNLLVMLFLILEPPLHPYQALRLQQCMRNAARLQQLGITNLVNSFANTADKNQRNHRSSEASDDEYDPSHDDTSEEDLFGDNRPKGLKESKKTCKKSNKKTVHMPPGGIRPRSKRVFAEQQTTRTTRLKTSVAPSNSNDINLAPQDPHASVEDDDLVQLDGGMANGAEHGGDIHMTNQVNSQVTCKCCFQGDKYDDEERDAFELFKACHYSKRKKGYTPAVQLAIIEMENKISAPTEGEEPNSATQVVADVLAEKTKKSQFL